MISSIQLEAFYVVAQTGHFTKAAERLHVTQSALSQRVLNLERELECALFIRDRAGLQLTEIGLELLRYCQATQNLENEFLTGLRGESGGRGTTPRLAGHLRIAAFSSVLRSRVMPALAPLLAQNPDVRLELRTQEVSDLPSLLKRAEVDYAVMDHILDREDLEHVKIGEERNVLVERKGYKGEEIYLDHDEKDETTRAYLKLARKKPPRLKRHFLDDIYGLVDGVRMGLGRAVLPEHLIEGHRDLVVPNPETVLKIPIVLHFNRAPFYTRLHHAVVKALDEI